MIRPILLVALITFSGSGVAECPCSETGKRAVIQKKIEEAEKAYEKNPTLDNLQRLSSCHEELQNLSVDDEALDS